MGNLKKTLKNHNYIEIELRITQRKENSNVYMRQFGWGDSLLKSNKGLQRLAK